MNLHEYQARILRSRRQCPCRTVTSRRTPAEAESSRRGSAGPVVVKAQVHVGGRGKAGGVKLAETASKLRARGRDPGDDHQGPGGRRKCSWCRRPISRARATWAHLDRESQRPVLMVSAAGGVDIEEVAATTPEKIIGSPSIRATGCFRTRRSALALTLYDDFAPGACRGRDHAAAVRRPSSRTAPRWRRSIRW